MHGVYDLILDTVKVTQEGYATCSSRDAHTQKDTLKYIKNFSKVSSIPKVYVHYVL
jgi:hypothetical protein